MTPEALSLYATFFKAIGSPVRLKIIMRLAEGEQCVCDIESELNQDISVVSRHLKQLLDNRIVSSERRGKKVFYKLEMTCILSFIRCIDSGLNNKGGTC